MNEEFEIKNFEDLIDVFENTGDFGKYYLGDYSNVQIANYLRKMQQENKQLKEELENDIDRYEDTISYQLGYDKGKEYMQQRITKAIEYIKENKYENTFRLVGNEETGEMESLNGELLDLLEILGDKEDERDNI